ncbi:hypothetical protein PIB30_103461, partial [Stylosanthes scabra]|nr:hypothetical protein [Stylosanthes scabra]
EIAGLDFRVDQTRCQGTTISASNKGHSNRTSNRLSCKLTQIIALGNISRMILWFRLCSKAYQFPPSGSQEKNCFDTKYSTPIWLNAPRTRSADIVTLQTLDSYL